MCQDLKKIRDPGSPGSRIRDIAGSWILYFDFFHGILEILDPVTTFPWDLRDLGSQTEKILLDPGDPGSSLSDLSWVLADLGSYTTTMPLYFEHHLQPMKLCFWFPISMRFPNLTTVNNFNHTLIDHSVLG